MNKPGSQTTEWKALLISVVVALGPVISSVLGAEIVPKDSLIYVVLSCLALILGYITQRGAVKIAEAKALTEAAKAAPLAGPTVTTTLPQP